MVAKPATPPSANAGADRQVTAGATVALDGTRSEGTDATYAWKQVAGPSVGALSGVSPSFTAPTEISRLDFELTVSGTGPADRDTVSLWVLEDSAHAYFVAKTGSDDNAGTRAAPFATIAKAIAASDADGNGGDVYIGAGTYNESVVLKSRVSLYGGFVDGTWRRDVATSRPLIAGGRIAVRGSDANDLAVDGVSIRATSAVDSALSSIALLLNDSRKVTVRASSLQAGDGAAGAKGRDGTSYASASDGSNGANAGTCTPPRAGGSGGSSGLGRRGGAGGNGGFAGGFDGADGEGSNGGANGKGGGAAGGNGTSGKASASSGSDGAGGQGGVFGIGALSASDIAIVAAGSGAVGGDGWGGGGG
ncbi:MAG: PKD domain-containing protein, partial [Solirubrobacteraceae bacterium]